MRRLNRGLAVVALVGTVAAACSSSSSSEAGGSTVTGAGVKVTVPDGWTSKRISGRGLVVASKQGDLDADVPSGPRLIANRATGEIPDPSALIGSAKTVKPSVRALPESVTVDGRAGIAVESNLTRGGVSLASRQVVVQFDQGSAYTFTLEAPHDQWDDNEATLQDILDSVQFT
jgi:hypothetical protein